MKKWFGLEETTVVVAGAGGLIGRATCRALTDCGALVIGLDLGFNENTNHQYAVDLTASDQVTDFFKVLNSKGSGNRKWAFVNSSYPRTENWGSLGFENVPLDEWNKNVEIHLGSAFHFSQRSVEFLKENGGGGSIVNFSSIYGLGGPDLSIYDGTEMKNSVAYSAIKSGIIGFTKYIATAFGQHNIRANIVAPGGVKANQPEAFLKAYQKRTPLGRMATVEDIAAVVAFLVSPAAQYITGHVVPVDGGWTAW